MSSLRARALADEITQISDRPATLMEVCGTHAHQFARYGLGQMLPPQVELLSGPGCPVCVTSAGEIDASLALARVPGVTIATFGDMVRVPGSDSTLAHERARGADVRVMRSTVFSPCLSTSQVDSSSPIARFLALIKSGSVNRAKAVSMSALIR